MATFLIGKPALWWHLAHVLNIRRVGDLRLTADNQVLVAVYDLDADVPVLVTAGFWVLVYGHDIQP